MFDTQITFHCNANETLKLISINFISLDYYLDYVEERQNEFINGMF